jgi:hypothetical protein
MKKNNKQWWLFMAITIVMMLIFCELTFRLALWATKKIPFGRPDLAIKERFYPELKLVENAHISPTNDSLDILILGGSVVADEWRSKVAKNLRDSLKIALKTDKVRYFNLANLGHTTVDNLYKYQSLSDKRFDLVIYYEGINETRFNNVPSKFFRNDYTHIRWYHDIDLIKQYPEMRYTIFPFVIQLISNYSSALVGNRYFMNDAPDPVYYSEGGNIKTAAIYKENLAKIIAVAQKRDEPLLMVNFTYYIPDRWRKSGFRDNEWDFTPFFLSSPIATWGTAPNVEKGILAHRTMMQQLSSLNQGVSYFDMNSVMPKEGQYFVDICHFTDKGSRIFANSLADFILTHKVLKTRF